MPHPYNSLSSQQTRGPHSLSPEKSSIPHSKTTIAHKLLPTAQPKYVGAYEVARSPTTVPCNSKTLSLTFSLSLFNASIFSKTLSLTFVPFSHNPSTLLKNAIAHIYSGFIPATITIQKRYRSHSPIFTHFVVIWRRAIPLYFVKIGRQKA